MRVEAANVLGEIAAHKRREVAARSSRRRIESLLGVARPSRRSLCAALARPGPRFVMECKNRSPSAGALRADYDLSALTSAYAGVADAVSVLVDQRFFGGSYADLRRARADLDQPLLCKDVVVDPYQIAEARVHGADAVLVMLSVLDDGRARECLALAERLGLDAVVEVHDEEQRARALALGARIVGINNRDLRNLEIDLGVTERLAPLVPAGPIVLSESGVRSRADVARLAPRVDAFLVGSSLAGAVDAHAAARRLVFGTVKICGLRRRFDARVAAAQGASYGGLVCVPGSPREPTSIEARALAAEGALPLVGVFADAAPARVAACVRALDLVGVQLHGREDAAAVAAIRHALPEGVFVWKALPVDVGGRLPAGGARPPGCDRLLLDTASAGQFGGSGRRFEWDELLRHPERGDFVLAGGLNPDNIVAARATGAWGLDVSSGVERAPGCKSPAALRALFSALRGRCRGELAAESSPEENPC